MKIGIISDIHGNLLAFKSALKTMRELKIDTMIFAGDICGYYFNSLEIIDELINIKNLYAVKGNHDQIFLDIYNSKDKEAAKEYSLKYGTSIYHFMSNANQKHISFLEKLPKKIDIEIDGVGIRVYHGGPNDYLNQKILPDCDFSVFFKEKADIIILGHSHYRINKIVDEKIIINPGSIGQPRDSKLPSFTVYDTVCKTVEFVEINYRVDKLINDILTKGKQPSYLYNVLFRPFTL